MPSGWCVGTAVAIAMRVELGILEQVVEALGESRLRELRRVAGAVLVGQVAAASAGRATARDVARQVRAPVAEADDADPQGSLTACTILPCAADAAPVALRKSTTSASRSTTRAVVDAWSGRSR